MQFAKLLPALLITLLLFSIPAVAQLTPAEPDPLARIRDASAANVQACSATGDSLCEQVAPKIIANAQGDSSLAQNVRLLAKLLQDTRDVSSADAVKWTVAAFRAAGLETHVEENNIPAAGSTASQIQQAIVAEVRGREKPEEWVLLGARIDLHDGDPLRAACNASLVVEAARDIFLTRIHPRRSIRFVIVIDTAQNALGFWPYVRAHRHELDSARAAIFFAGGAAPIGAYILGGRQDLDAGLRETIKPIASMNVSVDEGGASILTGDFDFLLEGVPTVIANQHQSNGSMLAARETSELLDEADVKELKRDTAVAGVTAFGIAERAQPLGPRQTHSEITSQLNETALGEQLRSAGLWVLWQSGERGRLP